MKQLGVFLIGLYVAIYGISLLTDPWTQVNYDRSVRELGIKSQNLFVSQLLKVRGLYGIAHIFAGFCLMNNISSMRLIITSIFILDIMLQFGFKEYHSIWQNVVLIGLVLYK